MSLSVIHPNPYNIPSVKTFMERLKLSKEQAKELRKACEDNRGLTCANKLLEGYGIETIGLPDGCFNNCQEPDLEIRYVNMGDTYDVTLCKVDGRYRVSSWGDVVEAWDRKHPRREE